MDVRSSALSVLLSDTILLCNTARYLYVAYVPGTTGDLREDRMNPGSYSWVLMTSVLFVAKTVLQSRCFSVRVILAFKCYLAYQKQNYVVWNHDWHHWSGFHTDSLTSNSLCILLLLSASALLLFMSWLKQWEKKIPKHKHSDFGPMFLVLWIVNLCKNQTCIHNFDF